MAEAAVERQPLLFFCHKCAHEICPVLPDYTCPRCQSGFIEELAQNPPEIGEPESDEENIDPSIQFAELWRDLIQDVFRREDSENRGQNVLDGDNRQPIDMNNSEGNDSSTPTTANNPLLRPMRRRRIRPRDARQLREMRMADMEGRGLHQLLASLTGNRAGYQSFSGFPIFFNLHGNPGDYAWGRGGLDAVISQLLNQLDGTGPPPLPKEKISEIPDVDISKEQVDKALQCTVCMEDFLVTERVKRLTCLHHFHRDCIVPWLELHGTCPICRKILHEPGTNCVGPNLDMPGTSSTGSSSRSSSTETSSNGGGGGGGGSSTRSSQSESSNLASSNSSSSSSTASHPFTSMYDNLEEFD